ncbi:unnamed protein product [Linum trigynum]|uniref:KIB1-4 beta-propeller domain-containing protein n=1 Tax=Linum trigynum TaxID=586398 RepID=A0AAV2GHT6_9ROSI
MIGEEGRSSTGDDEPWLVLFHGQSQVFYSTSNPKQIHRCRIPQFVDSHIIGHSQYGWLILRREIDDTATSFSLLNPVTLETIELPALNNLTGGTFTRCELTCPPSNPNCRVVIANNKTPQLAHCKPGDETWSVQTFSEEFAALYRLVICNQSLYALTANSQLLEITMNNTDDDDDDNNNNSLVASLLVESYPRDLIPRYTERMGYWNLVESGGELLWIILCHRKHSNCELDWVLVHKLDRSSMSWVRVNTLDGRAVFISPNGYSFPDGYSFSCSCNNNNGIKPNCIYFFLSDDYQKLFAFDVERGQALQWKYASSSDDDHDDDEPLLDVAFINYPAGHRTTPRFSLAGVETSEIDPERVQVEVHNETKRVEKEKKKEKENEEVEEEEEALIWKLPREIFTNIAKKLIDCRSFRTCCRKLKSAIPLPPPLYPWFFYFKQYKGDLNFQDLV